MSNETIAVLLTAFYIIASRKLDLCTAIILYYCAYILVGAYTVGLRVDLSPELFYLRQSLIDLAAIIFICYLSKYHTNIPKIYLCYAAIITISMTLNGLMLIDQAINAKVIYKTHLLYQSGAHWIDVSFAIIGVDNVRRFILRFLPFGSG